MDLLFVRHGIAEEHSGGKPDEERFLTDEGRRKTRRVAERLYTLDVRLTLLLTSPLVRARQTAEILLEAKIAPQIEVFAPLAPGGTLARLRDWLTERQHPEAIGLVGHQPDLGLWAEELIWGTARRGLEIKKAGVVRIELDQPQGLGRLQWFLPPKVLE